MPLLPARSATIGDKGPWKMKFHNFAMLGAGVNSDNFSVYENAAQNCSGAT